MQKVINLLGIAAKGNNVLSGSFVLSERIAKEKARKIPKKDMLKLLILATDASEETKAIYKSSNLPLVEILDKETLGHAIGKDTRACVGIIDEGLANAIQKQLASAMGQEV